MFFQRNFKIMSSVKANTSLWNITVASFPKKHILRDMAFIVAAMAGIYFAGMVTGLLFLGLLAVCVGFLLCSYTLRKRDAHWRDLGLRRPRSWPQTLLTASIGVIFLHILISQILKPGITKWTGKPLDSGAFESLRGNLPALLGGLVIVWTVAAFGEELVFRGFFLNGLADLGNYTRSGWATAVITSALLFGLGHLYQGITGVILSAIVAIVYTGAYFATGRNLWAPILIHGLYDTTAFIAIFLNWDQKIPDLLSLWRGL